MDPVFSKYGNISSNMPELPSSFYYIIGISIVANVGTIGTVLILIFKSSWWLSKLDGRVTDAKDTAIRAHVRLDKVVKRLEMDLE